MALIDPSGQREADGPPGSDGEASIDRALASPGTYPLAVSAYEGRGPYIVNLSLR
jgi:hypothetical protein